MADMIELLRDAAAKARAEAGELAKQPAPSLASEYPDVDAAASHIGAMQEMKIRYALAEVFDQWARMGSWDPDLLNRVGGPETVALARAILAAGTSL
jgi:hypothetical protein